MVDGMRILMLAELLGAAGCAPDDIYLDPEGEVSIDPAFAAEDQAAIISVAEDVWGRDTYGRVALRFSVGGPGMPIDLWEGDGTSHTGVASVGDVPPRLGLVAGVDRWTIAHELGHVMGLEGHSNDPGSLMAPEGSEPTAIDAETRDRFCARWGCP
jgi:hypothetical protein